jgi:hypothetical protein
MKIAVCTTFPNNHFEVCAAEMLASFHQYWPEDIKIYIQLDEQPRESFVTLNNHIIDIVGEERSFIARTFEDEQKQFIERWKDHKPKSYLDDVVKFSHKIFALERCAEAVKDEYDYLIWLDADVITKKPITLDWLREVLPTGDEVVSYLGRKNFYSECGFVAYNLKAGGYDLLLKMKNEYINDSFKSYPGGWTDCHVLDHCIVGLPTKNLAPFYVKELTDIDVWPKTKLAEKMAHRKGNRKFQAAENRGKIKDMQQQQGNGVVDSSDIKIKTRNCLDHDKIKANVSANLSQIRSWVNLCKRNPDGEVVICAAGPSLSNHIDEIKALQDNGAKVIAVKHAIETLKIHGIKPWAVVLLDPRGHVEGFVKSPDTDPVYFVASMCDPSVVSTLNDNKCKVIGYHAYVNAGETDLMNCADLPVSGGSATSTRSIGLFSDMFGYSKFHLFGYDLCHHAKPDMNEKNSDGQPKYMELTIGTNTYKGKYITRTFWTEGQFLAQSNELKDLYKSRPDLNINIYGDGMAGWLYKHHRLFKMWQKEYNDNLEKMRAGTPTLEEYVNAVTRGSELSRKQ